MRDNYYGLSGVAHNEMHSDGGQDSRPVTTAPAVAKERLRQLFAFTGARWGDLHRPHRRLSKMDFEKGEVGDIRRQPRLLIPEV